MDLKHSMRLAVPSDSENILKIYAPYITDTAVSFETEVPSVSDFFSRVEIVTEQYPFLVYQVGDEIVGFAYASKHRERAAYLFDVDVSIYVLPEYHGSGIANRLYNSLFTILLKLGYKNAYAAYTEPNIKSMKFHNKFGFTLIGTHHKTGYKFGQWHDVTWLEKVISEHNNNNPMKVSAISELSSEYLETLFCSNSIV
jgi:phosphinothricin acetyltransferase